LRLRRRRGGTCCTSEFPGQGLDRRCKVAAVEVLHHGNYVATGGATADETLLASVDRESVAAAAHRTRSALLDLAAERDAGAGDLVRDRPAARRSGAGVGAHGLPLPIRSARSGNADTAPTIFLAAATIFASWRAWSLLLAGSLPSSTCASHSRARSRAC